MQYTELEIDQHIGQRLRSLRQLRGFGQKCLGKETGVTFQQIQKYEAGRNRMAGSRIYQMASIMAVSPLYFFEGLDGILLENHVIIDPDTARIARLINNMDEETKKKLDLILDVLGCK